MTYMYDDIYGSLNTGWTVNVASNTSSITNQTYTIDQPYLNVNPPYTYDDIIISNVFPNNSLSVSGDANFEGDVKIKGKSLNEALEKIEEKLAILHPNIELEEKWEELRNLRKRYMELEKEIKEKENVWDILKR